MSKVNVLANFLPCLLPPRTVGSEDPSTCSFLQAPSAKSNRVLTIGTMGRELPCCPLFQSFSRLGTLFPSSFICSASCKRQVFKKYLRKTKKKEWKRRRERGNGLLFSMSFSCFHLYFYYLQSQSLIDSTHM